MQRRARGGEVLLSGLCEVGLAQRGLSAQMWLREYAPLLDRLAVKDKAPSLLVPLRSCKYKEDSRTVLI